MPIDIILRGSCGRSLTTYDIGCVSSLEFRQVDRDGQVLASQCTDVAGNFETLRDLVAGPTDLPVLDEVVQRDGVHLELRAYHAFDHTPCEDLAESELMMWSASDSFDLLTGEVNVVTLPIECRPYCDCLKFDEEPALCPASLEPGACTPLPQQFCRKDCDSTEECYGGEASCDAGECGAAEAAGMCDTCVSNDDCDSGMCVHNVTNGEQFCAKRCPPLDGVEPCPTSMSCRRMDGVEFELVP